MHDARFRYFWKGEILVDANPIWINFGPLFVDAASANQCQVAQHYQI